MEEVLYTRWKAQRWWSQVSKESSQWSMSLIFLRLNYLLFCQILILDFFFFFVFLSFWLLMFFPVYLLLLWRFDSLYLWFRVLIQALEKRFGRSFLECKHFHHCIFLYGCLCVQLHILIFFFPLFDFRTFR